MIMTWCKDCKADGRGDDLDAPYPGPRCYRHHKAWRRQSKVRAGEKRAERVYGITPEDLAALMVAQGGRCAWCRRKIGKTVRPAIDHDHSCVLCGGRGCRSCVRGLLDRKCNEILGWFGDDPGLISAGVLYLTDPPARAVLKTSV